MMLAQARYPPGANCASPVGAIGSRSVALFLAHQHRRGVPSDTIDARLARQLCLLRIDHGTLATASSTRHAKVTPPKIYYDSKNHDYFATLFSDWQDTAFTSDDDLLPPLLACGATSGARDGGADALGLSFNASLLMGRSAQSQWGNTCIYAGSTSTRPCESSQYGVAYCRQDKVGVHDLRAADLNMYHAEIVQRIIGTKSGKCESVQAFGKYGHTWSSTSVSGVSIGLWTIGISYSASTHRWYSASQAGGMATVC
jgi:hypothetical protein